MKLEMSLVNFSKVLIFLENDWKEYNFFLFQKNKIKWFSFNFIQIPI